MTAGKVRDIPAGMTHAIPAQHAPSWYAFSANPHPAHPALAGDESCDVCVVGAGYTGLTTALELAERGYSVIVLEAERVGWGASGRNGGQIITGYNKPYSAMVRMMGEGDARILWDLGEEAKSRLERRVTRHAIACDLTWGYLLAALKPRHMAELADLDAELHGPCGYGHARLIDAAEARTVVDSPRIIGGLYDARSGHIHPLNYALGLADAARAAGVKIFENSRVVRLDTGANPVAETGRGRVRARFLVLAGNAYLGGLVPGLARMVMPVATYIAATEPLGAERAESLLPGNAAVSDMNFVLNYFRRSPDHRLLFGGEVSYSGLDRPGLARSLRAKMLRLFPHLAGVRMTHCWGGKVAITVNRMPQIGRLSPTTCFAHGYSGHGVALSGMAGALMAEAIDGTAGRFDVMARIPHMAFPGGRLARTPALVLGMLWFRLRDLL